MTNNQVITNDQLVATRQAFGDGLLELMRIDERVMALTADLGESLRMLEIKKEMPDRFFDVGVAEANMVGVMAGLAMAGFIPVAGTFSVFMTRAFDHIRLQICQNNLSAILVGSHGGVSNAMDGGSANALEDIAYMRALPNMTIFYPNDAEEMQAAWPVLVENEGPVFLRLYREPTPILSQMGVSQVAPFELGKARVWREGKDVTVVAAGPQTAYAVQAAERLARQVSVEVIGVHTIAPIDVETIAASAAKTGRVVTAEDHNINGGLGSAVAEVLGEHQPTKMKRVGVRQFGESGKYSELIAKLGIDAGGIRRAIEEIINT